MVCLFRLHGINMVAKGKRDPDSQRHFMVRGLFRRYRSSLFKLPLPKNVAPFIFIQAMTADGLVVESGEQCLCKVEVDADGTPFFQFRAVLRVPSDPPPQLNTRLLLRNLRLCVDMPQLSKLAIFLFTAVPPELSAIVLATASVVAPAMETVVATILYSIMCKCVQ